MTDLELLRLQLASGFVLDDTGRLVCTNDPDRSAAPAFALAGCAAGNVWCFRRDVPDARVRDAEHMLEREPPLAGFGQKPLYLDVYRNLLSGLSQETEPSVGLQWHLPNDLAHASDAPIVRSGTEEGDALLQGFRREGMPPALFAMGFTDTGEFWPPWCALFCDGEVGSLAFAARLGRQAAGLGLVTMPAFRGRGFGAAVTAAWTAHPALAGRSLFYGTAIGNLSSQRVTARLGLRFIGSSCTIE
jgi:hypothetical protein